MGMGVIVLMVFTHGVLPIAACTYILQPFEDFV